jgi:carbon storage regulator
MLCLTRRAGENLMIGDDIVISFVRIKGGQVKVCVKAPRDVTVDREEIYLAKKANKDA